MIKFNELRISKNSKLIIDVSVLKDSYYKDVSLESIIIDSHETFIATGPSNHPIYQKKIISNDNEPTNRPEDLDIIKSFRIELDSLDLTVPVDKTMFFVYVKTRGTPSIDTPCGKDNTIVLGVAFSTIDLIDKGILLLKELTDECNTPKRLIMHILQLKALEISIATGHHTKAIEYWKMLNNKRRVTILKKGCNG